jgi:hypothetical protein
LTPRNGTLRLRFRRILIRILCPRLVPAGLIITGFAQSPSSSTSPPPNQSLRYEEDWTYLSDKTQRSDTLDTLKYIPLNQRRWYLRSEARRGVGTSTSTNTILARGRRTLMVIYCSAI